MRLLATAAIAGCVSCTAFFPSRYDMQGLSLSERAEMRQVLTLQKDALTKYADFKYRESAALYADVVSSQTLLLGADHFQTLTSMSNLAAAYMKSGNYVGAEQTLHRLIEARERTLDVNDPSALNARNSLAVLYDKQGRFSEAVIELELVLECQEKSLGFDFLGTLITASNLAHAYQRENRIVDAEEMLHRVNEVSRQKLDPTHVNALMFKASLASIHASTGRQPSGEKMLLEVIESSDSLKGETLLSLDFQEQLADIYIRHGNLAAAQHLYSESVQTRAVILGDTHPRNLLSISTLAEVSMRQQQVSQGISLASRLVAGEEAHLRRNLVGSEQSRQAFFDTFQDSTDFILSLHLDHAPDNPEALNLAAETWLRRKGRILEAQADTLAAVRHQVDDEGTTLLNTLQQLRRQEAILVRLPIEQAPKDRRERLDALAKDIAETERQMATRSHAFAAQTAPVTLQTVQDALPEAAALLQYAVYTPFSVDEDESPKPHLAAYILHKDGRLSGTNLGPLAGVAKPIEAFRQTRNPTLAAMLHKKLLAPLAEDLDGIDHLFVSPDGPLNLLPFEALLNAEGVPLLARQSLSYLDNGRDLLRYSAERPDVETTAPLVLANPTFGPGWDPLPGTAAEADVLHARYPDAVVHTGAAATVSALRDVHSPRVLHIATHGFFEANDPHTLIDENPMARSGLVLSGESDARLLATEAATLDLHGTELAVLSACETGLGEASGGEGVYGMRRALAMAGVESQVVSLWKVDDAATAAFMTGFHDRLLAGQERSEAMRQTKLAMQEADGGGDGMEWAAFVLAGEWR